MGVATPLGRPYGARRRMLMTGVQEVAYVLNWTYYPPRARILALVLLALVLTPLVLAVGGVFVWARSVGPAVAIAVVCALVVGLPFSVALVRAHCAVIADISERVENWNDGSRR